MLPMSCKYRAINSVIWGSKEKTLQGRLTGYFFPLVSGRACMRGYLLLVLKGPPCQQANFFEERFCLAGQRAGNSVK